MHCIHAQSAALVAAVMPPLIEEGYTFVRLGKLPAYREFETPPPEQPGPVIASAVDSGVVKRAH